MTMTPTKDRALASKVALGCSCWRGGGGERNDAKGELYQEVVDRTVVGSAGLSFTE